MTWSINLIPSGRSPTNSRYCRRCQGYQPASTFALNRLGILKVSCKKHIEVIHYATEQSSHCLKCRKKQGFHLWGTYYLCSPCLFDWAHYLDPILVKKVSSKMMAAETWEFHFANWLHPRRPR